MERAVVIEVVALYWPLSLAVLLGLVLMPSRRERAAIAMASTWQASSLALLNVLAGKLGWWEFSENQWPVLNMPASLYLGWLLLWGVVAVLLMKRCSLLVLVLCLLGFDLAVMPLLQPVLKLGRLWLVGELVLIVFGLVPGMLLARWVVRDVRLGLRAGLVSIAFVILITVVLPAVGSEWMDREMLEPAQAMPAWAFWCILAVMFFVGLPGLAAVMEFAREGGGTPIPFDPPKRLVTTGVYSYIANPMQASMGGVLLLEGLFVQNWTCIILAVVSVIYSEGIARWSEGEDMTERYGDAWQCYRKKVPRWRLSLLPRFSGALPEARIYYASECPMCAEIGRWFARQSPQALQVKTASSYPGIPFQRITYISATGRMRSGVDAIAAALQHIHLGWAMVAWLMQLPGIVHIVQLAMDASGVAPAKVE